MTTPSNDVSNRATFFGSVFFKAMGLVVTVAIILTVVGIQSIWQASETGTRILAQNLTEVKAGQSGGAIKFNKPDDLIAQLDGALSASQGMATSAVAVNLEGAVLALVGDDAASTELAALAQQAASSGEMIVSSDGMMVAVPSRFGPQDGVVGAVAAQWTAGPLLAQTQGQMIFSAITLGIVLVISGFLLRATVSHPLSKVVGAITKVEEGDLDTPVPESHRSGEVGGLAKALDSLRVNLHSANEKTAAGVIKGGGFEASSAAMMLLDENMDITSVNPAFQSLMQTHEETMRRAYPDFDVQALAGQSAKDLDALPDRLRQSLDSQEDWPAMQETRINDLVMLITASPIVEADGARRGYVIEWQDVTEQQKTAAIMDALESKQIRIEFDPNWAVSHVNTMLLETTQASFESIKGKAFDHILAAHGDVSQGMREKAQAGGVVFGKFVLSNLDATDRILDAALCPIKAADQSVVGYVLLGLDVTDAEEKVAAMDSERETLQAAQKNVVDTLRSALSKLSEGDLTSTISQTFSSEYEQLREDFNLAVGRLDQALGSVATNTTTIRTEADNISGAADDLSRRTERQASTLEETAAAVAQLTASVASAAQGARQANDVVTSARGNAEDSGEVVREAVTAMSEIEQSSEQISKIISVIDDIAFQTNLLALNAGVEAARAGDAGRGFAVVASEVRALAQRSSDAAREINELISTSGSHVKRGVELVGKTGAALQEIVGSVTDISELVSNISTSAQEQSTGLEEINNAMSQLDQVTQQNAAMFEETSAASQTLNSESTAMSETMRMFRLSSVATSPPRVAAPKPIAAVVSEPPSAPPQRVPAASNGNLAIAAEVHHDDDDWEDF
ncbi:MAG: methyl-accepting chemotaxis protein [Pseudomonadota bacterium]